MIALARPKKIVLFFILGLILSFFVYESRGASLSFIAALVSYFIIKIDHRIVRIGIVIVIFTVSILFFLFLDFATQEGPEAALLIVSQFSERGLAGREGALFYGYDLLKQSDFLGYGIWFSGGFEVVVNKLRGLEMIHIHYGLLDLALKFSIFTVILFLLALPFYIKKVTTESLPYVAGGLITIFYYNGLAPSHLGLNILLYLILGQAIMIHSKEIFK
jgi:energy-coupling factor transporter transmembrane protein EcfT